MIKTIAVVSVKKERRTVPRECIIKDLLREVRESLSIMEVQSHLKIRRCLGGEKKRVRRRDECIREDSVWEEHRGMF